MSDGWDDLLWDLGVDPDDVEAGGVIDLRRLSVRRRASDKLQEPQSVFAERAARNKDKRKKRRKEAEELFLKLWRRYGDRDTFGDPLREQTLVPGRSFAADFYWPRERVAVEVDGMLGKPSKDAKPDLETVSRHRSIPGVMKATRKRNLTILQGVVIYVIPTWWLRGGYKDLKKERRLRPQDFIYEVNELLRMRRAQFDTATALMEKLEEAQAWIISDRHAGNTDASALEIATSIAAVLSEARRVFEE